MKKNQPGRYIPAIVILAIFGSTACKKTEKKAETGPLPIEVALPYIKSVTLTEEYPGYLQALNTVNLVARVSGALQNVMYSPGQRVTKGQPLFVIEPTIYKDDVQQAEASLGEAKATLDYNKATYERTAQAAKMNAVSEIQVIQTKANYDQSIAAVKNAEAQLQTAKTNLGYCYISAPFTGRVSKNQFDPGNYLSAASSPTLATIYQDDKVYVNFSVSDNQYLNMEIKKNRPKDMEMMSELTIIPNAEDNIPAFKARLDYFAPNIDISTGTINMRGLIENKDGLLRDGLYVKVVLPYAQKEDAVIIPDASIGTDQLGHFVYVVNDSSKVVYRKVEPGQLINDSLRIINMGLQKNDRYVTQALLKVRPGMTIKPVMRGAKPQQAEK